MAQPVGRLRTSYERSCLETFKFAFWSQNNVFSNLVHHVVFQPVLERFGTIISIKKAECQRIDDFELWCWRGLWRVPWTARRFNQSILKEISPEYSLEGLMLKLQLQYFGHVMRRVYSLEKTLKLGGIGGRRRRG